MAKCIHGCRLIFIQFILDKDISVSIWACAITSSCASMLAAGVKLAGETAASDYTHSR